MNVRAICAFSIAAAAVAAPAMADWYVGDNATLLAADASSTPTFAHTTAYPGYTGYEFSTFTAAHFAAADAGPLASLLVPANPGWNNPTNGTGTFTGANSGPLNAQGAHWVHNSADYNNGGASGVSVLYSLEFQSSGGIRQFDLYYLTDNGLGNTNGAANQAAQAGFTNAGLWVNGVAPISGQYSSPGGAGQPAEFVNIQHLTFTALTTVGTNHFYFYEFNWGGPGGSAFALSVVPLPASVYAGLAGLAGVAGLGVIRRRRALNN